jgi:PIN domain nuclease of toxin-antitoxin system
VTAVLDASALLALLKGEPGAERVAEALEQGAYLSAVNLAEVLSKLADWGEDPAEAQARMAQVGLLGAAVEVLPFTGEDALEVARLRALTGPTAFPSATGPAWPWPGAWASPPSPRSGPGLSWIWGSPWRSSARERPRAP